MRRKHFVIVGALVLLAAVVSVAVDQLRSRVIPRDPDELILYSIDGHMSGERVVAKGQELLYGTPVLGRVEITDRARRREIIAAVNGDIRSGHPMQTKCFYPRHVLRVVKKGKTMDVVICFECHNYELYQDGRSTPGGTPSIGENSKQLLNKILTEAGVPIAQ